MPEMSINNSKISRPNGVVQSKLFNIRAVFLNPFNFARLGCSFWWAQRFKLSYHLVEFHHGFWCLLWGFCKWKCCHAKRAQLKTQISKSICIIQPCVAEESVVSIFWFTDDSNVSLASFACSLSKFIPSCQKKFLGYPNLIFLYFKRRGRTWPPNFAMHCSISSINSFSYGNSGMVSGNSSSPLSMSTMRTVPLLYNSTSWARLWNL